MIPPIIRWHHFLAPVLLAILSCDSLKEDHIQPERLVEFDQTEFYTTPGSAIVIDLKSIIKRSFTAATIRISHTPLKGEISNIDPFMLRYMPDINFHEGTDQFTISIRDGVEIIKEQVITVSMREDRNDLPCGLHAVGDRVRADPGLTTAINFLKNDALCGDDNLMFDFSISSGPRFGEARLIGDSAILYMPNAGFKGEDQIVYKITASPSGRISFGLVTITDDWSMRALKLPGLYFDRVSFVDENIGYIGGPSGFFKTMDGGLHWNPITITGLDFTSAGSLQLWISELFFLDSDHGYMTGGVLWDDISGTLGDTSGATGLAITQDGGKSWDWMHVGSSFTSVRFTSLTTGFAGEPHEGNESRIFKTTDGGQSWKLVLSSESPFGPLKFEFANNEIGYAYHDNKLFTTVDAGESWKLSETNQLVGCLAVTADNIVYSAQAPNQGLGSIIVRSEEGALPATTYFDRPITNLEFSRSGGVGFALSLEWDYGLGYNTKWISITDDAGHRWQQPVNLGASQFYSSDISVPSDRVAYLLLGDGLIKVSWP